MKVFELIEELQKFAPDTEVFVGISCEAEAKAVAVIESDPVGKGWENCITVYGSEYEERGKVFDEYDDLR